ncbi:Uncharacterised protein [Mycobacteroides abscessus subsp. abscessus]|nr:Uncharacterised protein [Mycobacteroides abscessus subsp. abscessus]
MPSASMRAIDAVSRLTFFLVNARKYVFEKVGRLQPKS